ncbi:hypothetical protein OIU76_017157 [Salix suchowensis]|nr:hypothetical protein OIU76_017157 [Salix suchowensis]
MAEPKENIVMFPFMAQGHIIPFLALALHIEKTKSFTITFVNTPLNIKKLKSSIPPGSSIKLLEIPFNSSDHGLPPNSENTDILPYPLIISLLHASTSLKPAFKTLIEDIIEEQEGKPPLCIIADIFFGWTATVAKDLGVFHAIFSGAGGFGLACYYSVWSALPHREVDSDEFELKDFKEASRFHVSQLPLSILAADGSDSWSVFQRMNLPAWVDSNGILFNTVEEFDQLGLMYFRKRLGRPAWAIGPVLLSVDHRARAGKQSGISADFLKNWLDTKPVSSVLYVSFGSNNTISTSQMMQLALALEGSGKNFIWVVRPPIGEQFFNVKFLEEELGVCVEIARGKTCEVRHEDMKAKFELVMNETEKGKEMRRKASEVKEMIRNAIRDEDGFRGSSVKELDDFFQAAMVMRDGADHKA